MRKLYYGPMIMGLVALAIGSELISTKNVLAADGVKIESGQLSTNDTENNAKSTHGTWEEAVAKYNTDLNRLDTDLNNFNGESELLTYVKKEESKLKANTPIDGKGLAQNSYRLRTLESDMMQDSVVDITVKNGNFTLTAKNVSATFGEVAGAGEMENHLFKSSVNNIKLSDGSELDMDLNSSIPDRGIGKATMTKKDGTTYDVPRENIDIQVSAGSQAADLLYQASETQDDLNRYDQSNRLVKAAKAALPKYMNWLQTDGKTSTYEEANSRRSDYDVNYLNPISDANLKLGPDVFPNPNGTTYVLNNDDLDVPSNSNEDSNDNSNPSKPDTNKVTFERPTKTPVGNETVASHPTVFMTSMLHNVSLYKGDGSIVKNRVLSKNSTWRTDKAMTLNGVKYLRVATNEWVKLDDGLEIQSMNSVVTTKNQASLYTAAGKLVGNRALAANSPWRTDRSATINGKTMYRVATNEWVSAEDIK